MAGCNSDPVQRKRPLRDRNNRHEGGCPHASVSSTSKSPLESRVRKIEPIHDLVVIITRCLVFRYGKLGGVGALEVDDSASLLIKKGVLAWIVERVVTMPNNFVRLQPRSFREFSLYVPNVTSI